MTAHAPTAHTPAADGYKPIGDYAVVGDCRSAALIARDGAVDWLCWPRFDSDAVLAAILDRAIGGTFRIRPTAPYTVERRYLSDTTILETTFRTDGGACVLRDLMPVLEEGDKRRVYQAEHELLRGVEGISGAVELEVVYEPRPHFGHPRSRPLLRQRGALGLYCELSAAVIILRSEMELTIDEDATGARGTFSVVMGERHWFSLSYSAEAPAVLPPLGDAARERLDATARWWRDWAGRCTYAGPYRDEVVRSALTLKLLTYAPSGAIIAAPTTSLPEEIGCAENWDYRYCWLRDASFTVHALYGLGYEEEANAFLHWILHATRLTWPDVEVLYDVHGNNQTPERELEHLAGYRGSRPVRAGNAAQGQRQLDVYGEVVAAALLYARRGGRFDRDAARLLRGIGDVVVRRWREPDQGIWEQRGEPRHFTHSKVLCWVALDGLIELHDRYGLSDLPVEIYRHERGALRAQIDNRGYSVRQDSFVRTLDGDEVDGALLTLPLYGYLEAGHSRVLATMVAVHRKLGTGVLLQRYPRHDGVREGAFGICCFWMVECQARAGDRGGAAERFEKLRGYANDVGLFAEEIDAETGAQLGNMPQGFTHVGLINAALALAGTSPARPPRERAAVPVRR